MYLNIIKCPGTNKIPKFVLSWTELHSITNDNVLASSILGYADNLYRI